MTLGSARAILTVSLHVIDGTKYLFDKPHFKESAGCHWRYQGHCTTRFSVGSMTCSTAHRQTPALVGATTLWPSPAASDNDNSDILGLTEPVKTVVEGPVEVPLLVSVAEATFSVPRHR